MSRLFLGILSMFACGWSAFTYIFNGMPIDKRSYWRNWLGFADQADFAPRLVDSIAAYREYQDFHHLKDVLVEWCRAYPQRAAKLLSLLILFLLAVALALALAVVFLLVC